MDHRTRTSSARSRTHLRARTSVRVVAGEPQAIGRTVALVASLLTAALLLGVQPHAEQPIRASAPSFLTRLLGAPSTSVGKALHPSRGSSATLNPGGYTVSSRQETISLGAAGAGAAAWQHFSYGGSRMTPFGSETVTVSRDRVEEFLVVGSHQMAHTWSWRLQTGGLVPRVGSDGAVAFLQSDIGRLPPGAAQAQPEGPRETQTRLKSGSAANTLLPDVDPRDPYPPHRSRRPPRFALRYRLLDG